MRLATLLRTYLNAIDRVASSSNVSRITASARVLTTRFRHGIGPFNFCLFSLDGKPPADWHEYITNTDLEPVQRRWNPKDSHFVVRDKVTFARRCAAAGLPAPAVIGTIGPSDMNHRHVPHIASGADLDDALSRLPQSRFFFKLAGGAHGHGAFTTTREGASYRFADRLDSADALYAYALGALPQGECYLVQSRLTNHRLLRGIMSPHGLGTVRLVTQLREGMRAPLSACLRITVGTNVTDNFSVGAAGNLTAAIDMASGRLGPAIGSRRRDWPDMHTVPTHPDTGQRIEGLIMPEWGTVIALALRAHQSFDELGVIGWDIAVTDDGPVLIEANHAWDINLLQVAHRRGFRSDMARALGSI